MFTCHGECVEIMIASWQRRIGIITTLVVVVFDVEAAQFRVFDAQRAARVVDILSVQRLFHIEKYKYIRTIRLTPFVLHHHLLLRLVVVDVGLIIDSQHSIFIYQFSRLCSDNIRILNQGLECIC